MDTAYNQPTSDFPTPNSGFLDVLIVDDETSILNVLSEIVAELDYRVRVAEDGHSALRALAERQSTLVITDIKMPGISGLELARQVKKLYPITRLILMTGYSPEQAHREADELKVSGFLKKPFKTSELEEMITTAISDDRP